MSSTSVTKIKDIFEKHTIVLPSEPVTAVMASQICRQQKLVQKIETRRERLKDETPLTPQETSQSMFSLVMEYSGSQKNNEELYREIISNGISLYDDTESYPKAFQELVEQSFSGWIFQSQNPEEYNDIINKAEIFHNIAKINAEDTSRLFDVGIELNNACDVFMNKYTDESYKAARIKVEQERESVNQCISTKFTETRDAWLNVETNSSEISEKTKKKQSTDEQIEQLRHSIYSLISSWTPQKDYQTDCPELINTLKVQLITGRDNIDNMLTMILATENYVNVKAKHEDLPAELAVQEERRSLATSRKDNIGIITSEMLTMYLNRFISGLDQMMEDAIFWGIQGAINATKVSKISVTGSDLHERGLGVCLITYDPGNRFFALKPDKREFEYELLRTTGKGSLGSYFEKYNETLPENKRIKTLQMFIAGKDGIEGEDHGTLVEGVKGLVQRKKVFGSDEVISDDQIDKQQNQSTAKVSALLGIRDLHQQNVQYHRNNSLDRGEKYKTYLLDGDIFEYSMLGRQTACEAGFASDIQAEIPLIVSEEMMSYATELIATKKRRLFLDTSSLLQYREFVKNLARIRLVDIDNCQSFEDAKACFGEENKACYDNFFGRLCRMVKGIIQESFNPCVCEFEKDGLLISLNALHDYLEGTVPFYEFDPNTGNILTRGKNVLGRVKQFSDLGENKDAKKKMIAEQIKTGIIKDIFDTEEVEITDGVLQQIARVSEEQELETIVDRHLERMPGKKDTIMPKIKKVIFPNDI